MSEYDHKNNIHIYRSGDSRHLFLTAHEWRDSRVNPGGGRWCNVCVKLTQEEATDLIDSINRQLAKLNEEQPHVSA